MSMKEDEDQNYSDSLDIDALFAGRDTKPDEPPVEKKPTPRRKRQFCDLENYPWIEAARDNRGLGQWVFIRNEIPHVDQEVKNAQRQAVSHDIFSSAGHGISCPGALLENESQRFLNGHPGVSLHQTDRDGCDLPEDADDWWAKLDNDPNHFKCNCPCDRRTHKLTDDEVVQISNEVQYFDFERARNRYDSMPAEFKNVRAEPFRGITRAAMEQNPFCTPIVLYQDDSNAKIAQARKSVKPGEMESNAARTARQAQYDSGSKVSPSNCGMRQLGIGLRLANERFRTDKHPNGLPVSAESLLNPVFIDQLGDLYAQREGTRLSCSAVHNLYHHTLEFFKWWKLRLETVSPHEAERLRPQLANAIEHARNKQQEWKKKNTQMRRIEITLESRDRMGHWLCPAQLARLSILCVNICRIIGDMWEKNSYVSWRQLWLFNACLSIYTMIKQMGFRRQALFGMNWATLYRTSSCWVYCPAKEKTDRKDQWRKIFLPKTLTWYYDKLCEMKRCWAHQNHNACWVSPASLCPLKLNDVSNVTQIMCYSLVGCPLTPLDIRRLTLSYALSWYDNGGNATNPQFLREICGAAGTSEKIVREHYNLLVDQHGIQEATHDVYDGNVLGLSPARAPKRKATMKKESTKREKSESEEEDDPDLSSEEKDSSVDSDVKVPEHESASSVAVVAPAKRQKGILDAPEVVYKSLVKAEPARSKTASRTSIDLTSTSDEEQSCLSGTRETSSNRRKQSATTLVSNRVDADDPYAFSSPHKSMRLSLPSSPAGSPLGSPSKKKHVKLEPSRVQTRNANFDTTADESAHSWTPDQVFKWLTSQTVFRTVDFDRKQWQYIDGEALAGQDHSSLALLVPDGNSGITAALHGKIRALFRVNN